MKPRVLFSWIGEEDFQDPYERFENLTGPIDHAVRSLAFDEVVLLTEQEPNIGAVYQKWLAGRTPADCTLNPVRLGEDQEFGEIYEKTVEVVESYSRAHPAATLHFNLSSGQAAMVSIWVLLAKTRFTGKLIEVKGSAGVREVEIPFDIAADYLPHLRRRLDDELMELSAGRLPPSPEFAAIVHRSPAMQRLLNRARRVAPRQIPVLILGESGTGKDLLARAIHAASAVPGGPFVTVNCGAIPSELVESELFGHLKGSFTGAVQDATGYIEAANGGTLFLDEIGELPLAAQVKLLRVLQDKQVTRVGATQPTPVDVRVIAATNRDLVGEVAHGRFREDLFHRLGVAILTAPPLREREGDLTLLLDHFLEQINQEAEEQPGYETKRLSAGARGVLLHHTWPGNVRELINTLLRAALWSTGGSIEKKDVEEALLPLRLKDSASLMERPLGEGFELKQLLDETAAHYLNRALEEAGGNKSEAARLVGLNNYQTFNNWLSRVSP